MSVAEILAGPDMPAQPGAHLCGDGVRFGLVSRHAERVELCLYDAGGERETARLPLPCRDGDLWHGFVPAIGAGQLYGYRVHGPYAPAQGHRFNPHKLLVDPYATELSGHFVWHPAVLGYRDERIDDADAMDTRDSAPYVPRSRVGALLPPMPGEAGRPPRPGRAWAETVIYEMHVRGFSMRHPEVPEPLRGHIAALVRPPVIDYLAGLGVTALEWMPVAAFLDELHLVRHGLRNYWGYNPVAPLALHARYGDSAGAFAQTVDQLHRVGLEVILDVVFNHTAEGDARGPTLSLRGVDNALYYRLDPMHPQRYVDLSGCGNTPDVSQPAVLHWVLAALRRWAVLGADGFRLDLAPALFRDARGEFDPAAPLLQAILADPLLSQLKWIAEPWDLAADGHVLGRMAAPVAQWNDAFRDTARRFWRGDPGMAGDWATRVAGSSDLFEARQGPHAGVNLVTAHDGFTLADLTAYARRHNQANGESNRDGHGANFSSNGGVEGATDDPDVLYRRRCLRRALLAAPLLSRGVPMLLAGDELSHSQGGNNNAYCQDNATTWLDWGARDDPDRDLRQWLQQALRLRRRLSSLRADGFFRGTADAEGRRDVVWLRSDGSERAESDWQDPRWPGLGMLLHDVEAAVLVIMQPAGTGAHWHLPRVDGVDDWLCIIDGGDDECGAAPALFTPGEVIEVASGALLVLVNHDAARLGLPAPLRQRARQAGIADCYTDVSGVRRQATARGLQALLARLAPRTGPAPAPEPASCWKPPALGRDAGRWLLAVQVYALRDDEDWGIGDFAALTRLVRHAAAIGASGVLLSPLHAPSLVDSPAASPYAPGSRLALNPLYVSVPAAARALGLPVPGAGDRADLHADELVDIEAVARCKRRALHALHAAFRAAGDGHPRFAEFRRFCTEAPAGLRDHARFEAVRSWVAAHAGGAHSWRAWPPVLRSPATPALEAFAQAHAESVERQLFMQWLARTQLQATQQAARDAGMELGLVADLALGASADGAEAWHGGDLLARGVELGAPPDAFAPDGQRWGLPPWQPALLQARDGAPFAELLDAVMAGVGGVRIDHILGLQRQFWVPDSVDAADGAYVDYPREQLLAVLAARSREHRCFVIGEDLGNVPYGLRQRLDAAGVIGSRVVWFERDADGAFIAPGQYSPHSLAMLGTHDLPTLRGFVTGADIDERVQRGLFKRPLQASRARRERAAAVAALSQLLAEYGGDDGDDLFAAAHRMLADCGSRLVAVRLEDVADMLRQPNLPGMPDVAPNWRQRLPVDVDALPSLRHWQVLATLMKKRRRSR